MPTWTDLDDLPEVPGKRTGLIDWDEVFQDDNVGKVAQLRQERDFKGSGKSLRSTAREHAKRRGYDVEATAPFEEEGQTVVYLKVLGRASGRRRTGGGARRPAKPHIPPEPGFGGGE